MALHAGSPVGGISGKPFLDRPIADGIISPCSSPPRPASPGSCSARSNRRARTRDQTRTPRHPDEALPPPHPPPPLRRRRTRAPSRRRRPRGSGCRRCAWIEDTDSGCDVMNTGVPTTSHLRRSGTQGSRPLAPTSAHRHRPHAAETGVLPCSGREARRFDPRVRMIERSVSFDEHAEGLTLTGTRCEPSRGGRAIRCCETWAVRRRVHEMMDTMNNTDVIKAFRDMHSSGCFVIPNPWNRGSAVALASMGFRALATSSAALAYDLGRPESPDALDLDTTLTNVREIVQATSLPVNADFQAGYGNAPSDVAASVKRCVSTGVAGLSIEDAAANADQPLYEASEALERVKAARTAIDESGLDVVLTARCEAFLVGHPNPLETALPRLVAFAEAGADCLFAPGLRTPDQIKQVVSAVAPKPVNVLAVDPTWMTFDALADLGVRRISVGSALARTAWGAFLASARDLAISGSFECLARAEPFAKLDEMFSR